jgi:glycosyltransferase involved in cell wall biosynthesis
LQQQQIASTIAAPGLRNAAYRFDELPVRRFAVSPALEKLDSLYGAGDSVAAANFARILEDEQPDVLHCHAFTSAVSLLIVRAAKQRGIPVVFTYHTPTVSCQRGTLLRWGNQVCDGKLRLHTCARCTLHGLGLPRPASMAIGSLPPAVVRRIGEFGYAGGIWTALRMTELLQGRHGAFQRLMQEVDRVVVLCRWTQEVLLRNGVPVAKIALSPHGLDYMPAPAEAGELPAAPPWRIAFFGRLDPTKGPDLLISALRRMPELPVELHLYGISQGASGNAYLRRLQMLANHDRRIRFLPAVDREQVIPLLRTYHLLAVPSRWLETGPLVVLEAFAAGRPVMGANLGGIAELVSHDVDGLLLEPDSVIAWSTAFGRLNDEPELYPRLRAGVGEPRHISRIAGEMAAVYRRLQGETMQPTLHV